jgi:hypothetical protein
MKNNNSMKDNSKISSWLDEIDNITNDFVSRFSALSFEELDWKPNPQSWSISQNIDHLIRVNETYYPIVAGVRNGSYRLPFIARFPFITNFFGKFILKAVEPERKKKVKTFSIWKPRVENINSDIINKFVIHQQELKKFFNDSRDLIEKETVIASPVNRYIVYNLSAAFDIIIAHEKRHFNQANEVLQLLITGQTIGK